MNRKTAFPMATIIFTALAAAFLAVVFTVPRGYICEMTSAMRDDAAKANAAIISGDIDAAKSCLERMRTLYEARKSGLEMLFYHEDLDELECSLNTAIDLARLDQSDNLICELHKIVEIVEHMDYVEMVDMGEFF